MYIVCVYEKVCRNLYCNLKLKEMKVTEKIQHIINILSQNDNKITTLPTSYKKAVKMITENRIFGIELIHIEDDVLGKGKDWIKKVSYYKVIRHEY